MQINFQRFKKTIAFLCGLCLSLSVFYSRSLITYALPIFDTIHINLSQDGMLNLSGSLDTSWTRSKTSDYIDISKYNSVSINPFNISGVSNTNTTSGFYESFRLYICYYDENKNFISNAYSDTGSITWSGSSPDYIFYAPQSGNLNIPNGAKYVRFSVRNTTQTASNKDIFYAYPIEFNLTCNYDDGSFKLNVVNDVIQVSYSLNNSIAQYSGNNVFSNINEKSSSYFSGSSYVLNSHPVIISGFSEPGYYDLDLMLIYEVKPSSFTIPTIKSTDTSSNIYYTMKYPSFTFSDIPQGLQVSMSSYSDYGDSIYNMKSYSGTVSSGGGIYNMNLKLEEDAIYNIHIYGTCYVDDTFQFTVNSTSFIDCQFLPVVAYSSLALTSYRASLSVDGIVQLSSHASLSEIEALENIDDSINKQTNEMIKEHEEELQKGQETSNEISSSLDNVTSTLTAIEILKLPWTMLTDLYNAIIKDGQTTLTFPSFELMGYTLWDAYEFDLEVLDTNFTVLFKSLRLISGILICSAFGIYIRNYFVRLFGGDVEVD